MEQIKSTIFYLIVFTISLSLIALYERQLNRLPAKTDVNRLPHRKTVFSGGATYAVLAIIILSLVAGLRGPDVGVDTSLYPVTFTYYASLSDDFASFLNGPADIAGEPLGALLVWMCAHLHWGVVPLLFCYQLLTVTPVFLAIRKLRGKLSITIGMAVYLFFFYNNSLNMMRQSVACAFMLYVMADYIAEQRMRPRCVVMAMAAILFHKSALYGALLIGATLLIMNIRSKAAHVLFYLLIIVSPLVMTEISQFLISSGIADSRMQTYINIFVTKSIEKDWFVNPLGLYSLAYLLIYGVLISIPAVFSSSFFNGTTVIAEDCFEVRTSRYLRLLNYTGCTIYIILLFATSSMYGMRFSIYFDFLLMLSIPLSCENGASLQKKTLLGIALITFWFIWIICAGWSGSQVYTFFFE